MKSRFLFPALMILCAPALHAREPYLGPTVLPEIPVESPAHSAYDDYRSGRRCAAQEQARPLAATGNGDAQFLLGFAAEAEATRAPSRLQAMLFSYREAAREGSPEAPWRLAITRWDASSGEEKARAAKEIETAANEGNPRACRIYAEAWKRGIPDGKPNTAKAVEWLTKAATLGDTDSFVPLGALLLLGEPRNEEAGNAWLHRALDHKNPDAFLVLGDDAAQVKKDEDAAMQYYHQGADAGQTDCMLRIATHLQTADSAAWLKKSADAGNPRACHELAKRLLEENPSQLPAAYHYFLAAAKDGVWQAQYQVAMIQLDGRLGESDPVAAVAWLLQAIAYGDPEAQFKLATLNEAGIGGPPNYANAGILYNLACTKGHAGAAERIAHMAYEGIRLTRSNPQAWAYAKLAVSRGNLHAKPLLDEIDLKISDDERAQAAKALEGLQENTRRALEIAASEPAP